MKYLKIVIRLVLFVAVSWLWIFFLTLFAVMETIVAFVNWFNDYDYKYEYEATIYVFRMYKWVRGG